MMMPAVRKVVRSAGGCPTNNATLGIIVANDDEATTPCRDRRAQLPAGALRWRAAAFPTHGPAGALHLIIKPTVCRHSGRRPAAGQIPAKW